MAGSARCEPARRLQLVQLLQLAVLGPAGQTRPANRRHANAQRLCTRQRALVSCWPEHLRFASVLLVAVPCFMVSLPTQKASAARACGFVGAHAASMEGSPCSCSCCIQVASSAPKPRGLLVGRLVSPAWYRAVPMLHQAAGCCIIPHMHVL